MTEVCRVAPNLGWAIRLTNENETGRFDFASRETTTPPKLVVTVGSEEEEPEPPGQCQTVTVDGDTYVRKGSPNQNEGGVGMLRVRSSGSNRALLQIDAQSLIDASAGETVDTAELKLAVSHNGNNWGDGREVDLHALLVPWDELTATWNCGSDSNIGNQQPDCDSASWDMNAEDGTEPYDPTPTDTVVVTNETTDLTFDVTADVQAMIDGTAIHGWIIRKREEGQAGLIEFVSHEASATAAPQIIVCPATDGTDPTPPEDCRNGIDDDEDGSVDCADPECQVAGPDATCDGVDDDCDGLVDEDFTSQPTECGTGACAAIGVRSCISTQLVDSCVPGTPGVNDVICDGVDEDCDGTPDEDYAPQATVCGLGPCTAAGATSCVDGTEQDSCVPGVPASGDACNGIDEDCDGATDEDFVSMPTSCGVGACASSGFLTCLAGAVFDTCSPGTPAADDATCDGIDDDCDGQLDEDCCIPATCQDYNIDCGSVDDGCGGTIDCGTCQGEETCGGGGVANVCGIPLPPDPADIVPDAPAGVGSFLHTFGFLLAGENPVQTGVVEGALEEHRAALVRGRVLTHDGAPLSGVQVSVKGQLSLGSTVSRADGEFDLLVNGGGRAVLQLEALGYLPVQRAVKLEWGGFAQVPDVVLIPQSDVASPVTFDDPNAQFVESREVTDQDGARRVSGFIPAGTVASAEIDGQTVPLASGTLRMTEFTVGDAGPAAMPAELPENSLYTFAMDLSFDEVGPRAKVTFSETTYFYLDNFLNIPIGAQVPNGYYDYEAAGWVPKTDGLVVGVVGISPDGLAEIDATDGDTDPEDAQALAILGFTDDERRTIAERFAVGSTIWRMPIDHLSPYDWNFMGFLREPPPADGPPPEGLTSGICPTQAAGSILYCEKRALAEEISIAGTPHVLRYDSSRASANVRSDRTTTITLPTEYPDEAQVIIFQASVLGRTLVSTELPLGTPSYTVSWDGLDAYEREWLGTANLEYSITYRVTPEFGAYLNTLIIRTPGESFGGSACFIGEPCCTSGGLVRLSTPSARSNTQSNLGVRRQIPMGTGGASRFGLGGWSLDNYHAYEPYSRTLIRGDGTTTRNGVARWAASVIAGRSSDETLANDVPTDVPIFNDISEPLHVAAGPSGEVYFSDKNSTIWQMDHNGSLEIVFTQGQDGLTCWPTDLAVNNEGDLYAACATDGIVRITDDGGQWGAERIIGLPSGSNNIWSDGEPLFGKMIQPNSLAFREDGTLFFTAAQASYGWGSLLYGRSTRAYELVEVLPDGRGRIVEPSGTDANGAGVVVPIGSRIAASADNTLVSYSDGKVVQIFASTATTTIMNYGGADAGFEWESTETHFGGHPNFFSDIASSPEGGVYVAFTPDNCLQHTLYHIASGLIRRVSLAGLPQDYNFTPSGCIAGAIWRSGGGLLAKLDVGPGGVLVATDRNLHRIYALDASGDVSAGGSAFQVVSEDGNEIYHFSATGAHQSTSDAQTGAELFRFTQDAVGRLQTIEDRDGRGTTFDYPDPSTIRISAPGGPGGGESAVTELRLGAQGHLEELEDPRGGLWAFRYREIDGQSTGLLEEIWDPHANAQGLRSGESTKFVFEEFQGRSGARWLLSQDTDPVGGQQGFPMSHSRVLAEVRGTWCDGRSYLRGYKNAQSESIVSRTTSGGRTSTYTTTVRTQYPYLLQRQATRPRFVTSTRTDPSGWTVTRTDPDPEHRSSVFWPGGSLSAQLTSHPRLGAGVLVPESLTLHYDSVPGRGALQQDIAQTWSSDFTATVGYSTPDTETVTTIVTPGDGSSPRTSISSYDGATRTTTITSAENRTSGYVLDDKSRLVRLEQPGQVDTVYLYDGEGYLSNVIRAKSGQIRITSFGYDTRGYVNSVLNRVSSTVSDEVTMQNDAMGFTTQSTVEPGLLTVGSTPDAAGALSSLTPDGKPAHQLSYTPLGQLSQYASPAGMLSTDGTCPSGTQCWRYSPDREIEDVTLPDGTLVDYVYDPQKGTLTSVEVPGHGTTSFTYDNVGRRDSAAAPTGGTMTFGWQSTLPIRSTWQGTHTVSDGGNPVWSGILDGTLERFYNDFLEVSELHVAGGARVRLLRDKDGLVTDIEDVGGVLPALTLGRSPIDGHVESTSLGTVTTTNTLDVSETAPGFGDLLQVSADAGGADLYDASYTYDDRGRIDTWTETALGSTLRRKFHYDAAGRLVEVEDLDTTSAIEEYAYDGNGNRTRTVSTGLSAELGTNLGCTGPSGDTAANAEDQLCRYGAFEYHYNARGQLRERERVSDGAVTQYTYDGLGRLKKVTTEAGLDIHYVHDALGRRIGKVVDSQLDRGWLYADALNPIAQLDENGEVEATFIYGTRAHVPDAMAMADGTVYRLITDHLGSVRLVVNVADGTVVQRLGYDSFGRVLNDTNPGFQPFGFAGGLYDRDTGLVRFGARDYDAYAGRWTAKDPILFEGGDTLLYAYVGNDPVNWRDPSGLYSFSIGFSVSGGLFGFGGSFTLAGTYIFDSRGISESGVTATANYGASGTVYHFQGGIYTEVTDAEQLSDLEGEGEYIGRAGLNPFYVGYVQAEGQYQGLEACFGAGFGFQFAAAGRSNTEIFGEGPWE